ncbi:hypothetical protein J5N97_000425 [Dioscorea zingiberensis]|uniref:ABC transporter D family member 1 n=1 Tax=Dioscorea zingiberensis TaxID=325984 RepID=A0A9D5BV49_9LILI|nr:hypothetical protein J5N97_000425 [Dioscorea zingiberensis]
MQNETNDNSNDNRRRIRSQKNGGLRSIHVLAAILISRMGPRGMQNLLALVTTVLYIIVRSYIHFRFCLTALSNRLAKVQGFLFRAAFLNRVPVFVRLIVENLVLCFLQSTLFSTTKYLTGSLGFANMVYYKISHVDDRINNPEQRIASDIPRFCTELSEIVQEDLTAVTDGLLYTWRLCSYASPKYVLWILAYVLGAGAAIKNFSPAFGRLMSKEQQLEGDYRQLHSRLRNHAESVAFYGGENREAFHICQQFNDLVRHMNLVHHNHWWFGMIQDFLLKYLGATVAVVLIIEPFFAGNLKPDSSTLGRAEMLSNLRYHTSVIISLFQSLATLSINYRRLNRLSGYADRIRELMLVSRELSSLHESSSLQNSASKKYITETSYIEFAGVKVVTPTGNVLVDNLSLKVESGSNLLITGPNGSGKSSLFEVLGGLWPLKSKLWGHNALPFLIGLMLDAIHDIDLSFEGEGGWSVQDKRDKLSASIEAGPNLLKASETDRHNDALAVQKAFTTCGKKTTSLNAKDHSYSREVISFSPEMLDDKAPSPVVPQLQKAQRALLLRIATMFKILVPSLLNKQGAQLLAVALLVVSRTWISDRIANLNGTSVKHVLAQDKAAFIRLTGVSVLQSAASSIVAPSLRYLTAKLALGWRIRLTQHLLKSYFGKNAYYKVVHFSGDNVDADQRITNDLEKLTTDLSGLVTGMVKPYVDILWFTWRMKLLTGRRGVLILYAYMLLGLGFLRSVTPEFGDLASREQHLEGTFRFMHSRLRTHAESVAFFGGGSREKSMVDVRFRELLSHSKDLLRKKWLFGILDDFITKQLPHNVTWVISLLYALEHKGDRALTSTQGELAHALRFLASVVSQSFLAFGDILELHRKFLELSGGINRIFELEELLDAAQSDIQQLGASVSSGVDDLTAKDIISFSKVSIISPGQKLLARKLTCDVVQGKSLLVTGPNGSGKSSIFRVLRGLWPIASGRLIKPSQDINEKVGSECGVFYVPQRPYTSLGTLRDQIIYPLSREEAEVKVLTLCKTGFKSSGANLLDAHLRSILESVRLVYLLEREDQGWDASPNWEEILSLGEQQRLGMARLFFHHPKFGILDECTNATSVDVEEHLYQLAAKMGITFITSSQRPALIPFHSMELRLIDGEGKWELYTINQ